MSRSGIRFGVIAATLLAFWCPPSLAASIGCGQTITQDATLESDLVDCPGDGLVIGANGVALDLAGHTIDGAAADTSAVGIDNGGHSGVVIKNGYVQQFGSAVRLFGDDNVLSRISTDQVTNGFVLEGTGLKVVDNDVKARYYGVGLARSDGGHVARSVFDRNKVGNGVTYGTPYFYAMSMYGDHNVFTRNALESFSTGLFVSGAGDNVIEQNVASGTYPVGMVVDGPRNRVDRNTVSGSLGLFVSGADAVLSRNEISYHTTGIEVWDADRSVVDRNSVVRELSQADQGSGIAIFSGDGVAVSRNTVHNSNGDGIWMGGQSGLLDRNRADENAYDGIAVLYSSTTVSRNEADGNGHLGIYAVAGTVDGGGNRASGNADPLQCVNVFCR